MIEVFIIGDDSASVVKKFLDCMTSAFKMAVWNKFETGVKQTVIES